MRAAREISVEEISSGLMLSKSQVLGLERADPSPFYSSAYFLRGLRKYMAFAGIPDDELNEVVEADEDEEDGFRLTLAEPTPSRAPAPPARVAIPPGIMQVAAVAAVVTVLAIGAYRYFPAGTGEHLNGDTVVFATDNPLPAQPLSEPQVAQPSVRPVRRANGRAARADDSTVRISVGKPTWVFIRYPDDRVIERRLEAGEALQVGPLPLYLAVGSADSVELRVENRPVPLAPYIKDGQVRLTQPELAKLVP
jgi:transcriptional regulator with XRE-family HTH domain